MKKILFILTSAIFLSGCTVSSLFNKRPSGLDITTNPTSTVFLNGENVGSTPYSNKAIKPGEYTIKLVPSSGDFTPYEIKRTLSSEVSTVISRNFAPSDPDSSGYILMLEPDVSGKTYLSVISEPDAVNVNLDDKPSGFTPLSKIETTPGAHSVFLSSPGFLDQTLGVNTVKGYNLVVSAKLASQSITLTADQPTPDSTPSASLPDSSPLPLSSPSLKPSPSPLAIAMEKPYVVIGETETGWLRVRKDASGTSEELGKANTGEKLKYLGVTTENGWHKIEFSGSVGYVSGKYVTLVR